VDDVFRRQASDIRAGAANVPPFDDCCAQPSGCEMPGKVFPSLSAAKNYGIVLFQLAINHKSASFFRV
jgi:hypothetical protein